MIVVLRFSFVVVVVVGDEKLLMLSVVRLNSSQILYFVALCNIFLFLILIICLT